MVSGTGRPVQVWQSWRLGVDADLAYRRALISALRAAPRRRLVALVAVLLGGELLPSLIALATGEFVSAATSGGPEHALWPAAGPLLALAVCIYAAQWTNIFGPVLRQAVARAVDGAHRSEVCGRVLAAPDLLAVEDVAVYDDVRIATARPTTWTERTPGEAAVGQLALTARTCGAISLAAVIAAYSWWLVVVLFMSVLMARRVLRRDSLAFARVWTGLVAQIREAEYWRDLTAKSAGAREIRVFGLRNWLLERWRGHVLAYLRPSWAAGDAIGRWEWIVFLLPAGACGLGLSLLGSAAADQRFPIAGLASATAAVLALAALGAMDDDAFSVAGAQSGVEALARLRTRFPEPKRELAAAPARPGVPHIRFEGVGFSYPGASGAVLRGFDMEIRPGEVVAVVGANGAGKTTFAKLLTGLYRPGEGRITADGVDVRETDTAAWRSRFAVVFQDFARYPLSLAENLTLGAPREDEDHAMLESVAVDSGVGELLTQLPDGWSSRLSSERAGGVDLSGGQWQHVALARALYAVRKGAGVLVMDEPTAHLDIRTETEVFQRILRAAAGVSVVLIAHRVATVREADRIVVLEHGAVVETGTHNELIAADTRYAAMFRQAKDDDAAVYEDSGRRTALS
jgi:ATP-binding cassette subfamily B protein